MSKISTRFSNFCKSFDAKKAKVLCLLIVCAIGAICLAVVPSLVGGASAGSYGPPGNGGTGNDGGYTCSNSNCGGNGGTDNKYYVTWFFLASRVTLNIGEVADDLLVFLGGQVDSAYRAIVGIEIVGDRDSVLVKKGPFIVEGLRIGQAIVTITVRIMLDGVFEYRNASMVVTIV